MVVMAGCLLIMAAMFRRLRTVYDCRTPAKWLHAVRTQHPPRILSAFFWEAFAWEIQRSWFLVYRVTERPAWMLEWAWLVNGASTLGVLAGVFLLFSIPGPGWWGRHWWKYVLAALGAAFVSGVILAWQA